MVTLGELAATSPQYGVGLSSREWTPGRPRYIRITDIQDDGELTGSKVAPDGSKEDWQKALLKPGDLLFARSGATVGKTYLHREVDFDAVYAGYLIRFQFDADRVIPEYVFRYTQSVQYRSWVAASQRAVAQPNVNAKQYASLAIPLPPLEVQRRVVEILSHADTLRAKRREAIARLDELAQSIFIDMFGDPIVNRMAFPVVPLTQVGHLYSGGTPSKATPGNWEGSLPWFSPKDLKKDDLFDSQDHINERITERTSLKLLPPNTVVFVVRGMILAHSFPVSILRVRATINQDIKAVLPSVDVTSDFLAHNLRVQTNNILAQVSTAGHGTKRLDSDGMSRIPVLLPPIELQREFDARIELIRHLRTRHQVALSSLDMLFSALQARLFRGAL
ncbi:restriction endonuclease subunit S [Rhodococcus sp. PAE-6]|uniref:restriction endonuclease subunit S n=1 Tax=Rhodococcus TaxID=1827 RepID=UPI0009B87FD0|nr:MULTISPECIES: restriction endonuclease subunit S [Rhodococcus]MCT7291444.1 restriction endonuclease subunit S [Rhodococcus sp. PAE-6]